MVDYKFLYAYSVDHIKRKINRIYQDNAIPSEYDELYEKAVYGLFLCLDMMRTDVIVWDGEKALKEVGLDFDPLEKYDSGTMFDDIDDEVTD